MEPRSPPRVVFRWCPTRTRRWLVGCGLILSALIGIARIAATPWSWQHVDDTLSLAVFLGAFGSTAVLLCLDFRRQYPPGCCCKCGYDLTGNLSGVCPECGAMT
ncbi:MAG TPA: hypothetical protein PKY77_15240 [Phycisphaerae bacterium]|nr:hypothetical protein [Phycisphaerae bacterium]HRY68339.1 hypothetical protein [Phycisphaerae bacterium]HSA26778.1 hypothetical protein [Phycisphaerae bacterium]